MFSRTPNALRCSVTAVVLSAFLFASGNAAALGLGDLVVRSRLGQTLRAEIRLLEAPGQGNLGETCFRLGEAAGGENLPVLTQGRLRLEQGGGHNRLVITSLQTINEPALQINVRVGCGAELVRSYTLLIDPSEPGRDRPANLDDGRGRAEDRDHAPRPGPPVTPAGNTYPAAWESVEGESAMSITQALFPRQPRAQRRFLNALREANPQVDFGEKGEQPLDAGVSLVIPDTRRAPVVRKTTKPKDRPSSPPAQKPAELASVSATGQMSDRLTISGDAVTANEAGSIGDAFDPALRYSSDLSIGFSDKVSENTRAMLRVEYRLLNALVFQAEKQLELAEQLRNLEARFEEMRATNESVANPAVAQTQPPLAAKAPDEEVLADAAQPKEKEAKPATAAPVTEAPAWWPPVLLLLALSGLLAWWLARRSRAGKAAVVAADLSEADLRATSGAFAVRDTLTRTDPLDTVDSKVAAKVLAFQPDIPLDVSKPLPFHDDHEARTAPPASAIEVSHVEEADDSGTVLELAEIMVSFGRVKGACQALAEYLENNPDASLLPWLKLLEIYRMNDMRDEFVDCSTRLRSHFNVAPASWDEAGACLGEKIEPLDESELSIDDILQKLPTVGTFPHIREGIAKTWGTTEGLAYLKHLLRDTRNGQRTGFPLSIAREILFLLDLLETRLHTKA